MPEPTYNAESVDKGIDQHNRNHADKIGGAQRQQIHAILKGRKPKGFVPSTGTQPGVGGFWYCMEPDGQDWCIMVVLANGDRHERWCSTWQDQPCNGLTRVYEILRSFGFTMAGETAD
jgi:hypothetical protein